MRRTVILSVMIFLLVNVLQAQVATGLYAMGPYSNQGFDTINLANLNAHFSVPVFSKTGRGGMEFHYNLVYDSSIWTPVNSGSAVTWQPATNWGWLIDTSAVTGSFSYTTKTYKCYAESPWEWETVYSGFTYTDINGASHRFVGSVSNCPAYPDSTSISASDGSGYVLSADSMQDFSLSDVNGRTINPVIIGSSSTSSVTDRNGNQIVSSGTNFTDTTGSTVLSISGSATQSSPRVYTYPVWESTSSNTTSGTVTVNYTNTNIKTNFGCSSIGEYTAASVPLVSSIVLADGGTYSFTYEQTTGYTGYYTGRIKTVTLPTGGVIEYDYSGGSNGIVCADGGTATLTRKLTSVSGTPQWVFARTPGSTLLTTHTVVTDGLTSPNSAVYDFVSPSSGYYYQTNYQQYEGSATGTPLLSAQTCYNGTTSSCTTQSLSFPITSIVTTNTYDGTAIDKEAYTYNSSGLLTEEDDYDFVSSGSPTTLIRQTKIDYESFSNAPGSIQDVYVYDGSSHVLQAYGFNYDGSSVTSTSGLPHHITVTTPRRNITSKWILNASPQVSPTQYFTYDDAGQILTNTDFNGNSTTYTYDSGTDTFVTQTTLPATSGTSHIMHGTWDVATGVKKTAVDQNSNTTSYTYDAMLRLASITAPGNSSATTSYGYNLTSGNPYASTSALHSGSSYVTQTMYLDPYGRVIKQESTDTPSDDYVDFAYDGNGNLSKQSNPYRTGDTERYTTYAYDGLRRLTTTTNTDASYKTQTFSGSSILYTDEASKLRKLYVDGIGRISKVLEPDSSGSLTLETDYLYAQNYSTSGGVQYQMIVQQKGGSSDSTKWRQRTFTYDEPGRLLSESTPEGGLTSYLYHTSSGNSSFCSGDITQPCSSTDANGTTITLAFDALNRLTGKTYSGSNSYSNGIATNTPSVSYYYDQSSYNGLTISNGVGLRTGMSDGSGATAWSFDVMGRTTATRKTLNSVTKQANYTYYADGTINTLQDFSGTTFTYSYDVAGRQTGASDGSGNNYASSATYNAANELTGMTNQLTSSSALYARTIGYNNRLQISSISATLNGSTTIQSLGYVYGSTGTDNGNITSITNGISSSRNQTYSYDNLNRLLTGQDSSHWGENYTYDNWGNLYQTTPMSGLSGNNWSVTASSTNQLSNLQYDAAGEVTQDQLLNSYTYNAEGRILTAGSGTYVYDGDGNRVKKSASSTITLYWPGAVNGVLDESDGTASNFGQQVIVAGVKVWSKMVSGTGVFLFQDHLGSTRVTGDTSGNVKDDIDYYPFGGIEANYSSGSGNHYLFTGIESDAAQSSTHYAIFRNLGYTMGRFNRPDPYGGSYDYVNPQSLNRYAYVANRPLIFNDLLGLDVNNNGCSSLPSDVSVCVYGGGSPDPDPGTPTPNGDPSMLSHGGGNGSSSSNDNGGGGSGGGSNSSATNRGNACNTNCHRETTKPVTKNPVTCADAKKLESLGNKDMAIGGILGGLAILFPPLIYPAASFGIVGGSEYLIATAYEGGLGCQP